MFTSLLYLSLSLCAAGFIYKISGWFRRQVGLWPSDSTFWRRLKAAASGLVALLFSARGLISLSVALLRDVLLQRPILAHDPLRWLMHLLIFLPFLLLLLLHGLDQPVTARFFPGYLSTLNPWFFLRDLLGLLVLVGLVMAARRRYLRREHYLKSGGRDHFAIVILAVIILSGFMLQGARMISTYEFEEMVYLYSSVDPDNPDDIAALEALEAYWVENHGLYSARMTKPFEVDQLAYGEELHRMECAYCHAPASTAFVSFSLAGLLRPLAPAVDRLGLINLFYWLHVLACLIGLACLPFTKLLHMVTTPLSLLVRAAMKEDTARPLNIANRRALEPDACMHCGTCSSHCSVRTLADLLDNPLILPAEKISFLKKFDPSRTSPENMQALCQGLYLCTNCDRCTDNCPAGIHLRELWWQAREKLVRLDGIEPLMLSPLSLFRGLRRHHRLMDDGYAAPLEKTFARLAPREAFAPGTDPVQLPPRPQLPERLATAATFRGCFSCCTCTTVCPVVQCYETPEAELGLLPHQIMNCLGLGLMDMTALPAMLYNCTTCYQCQEHCPQQVEITDIFYQLKNRQ